jgi:carbonic anhydrase
VQHTAGPLVTAEEALQRLKDGNDRFLAGAARNVTAMREKLAHLARGQSPYATILCCSDSRVPPEIVFDACIGELFVVRVAGNVVSPEVGGSLQYAGSHLGTPLFVVLGHEGCGAVEAALDTSLRGTRQKSRIQILVDSILPGLAGLDTRLPHEELMSRAVEANVRWTLHQLLETPEAQARKKAGEGLVVGAIYELESGRVRFLPDLGA